MDDTISRAAVLDEIHKYMEERDYTIGTLYDNICEMPSAQQWIPCSERLPEENKAILLGVKYKDDFKMFVTARMDITYWQGLGRDIKCQEMRWMPLPAPWEGEKE